MCEYEVFSEKYRTEQTPYLKTYVSRSVCKPFNWSAYLFDIFERNFHSLRIHWVIKFWAVENILSHCVKSFRIRSYFWFVFSRIRTEYGEIFQVPKYGVISGPYFPAFGLNTKRYKVSLRIQSKCGKIRTRNNSVFGHFSCSATII